MSWERRWIKGHSKFSKSITFIPTLVLCNPPKRYLSQLVTLLNSQESTRKSRVSHLRRIRRRQDKNFDQKNNPTTSTLQVIIASVDNLQQSSESFDDKYVDLENPSLNLNLGSDLDLNLNLNLDLDLNLNLDLDDSHHLVLSVLEFIPVEFIQSGNQKWRIMYLPSGFGSTQETFDSLRSIWPFASLPRFPKDPIKQTPATSMTSSQTSTCNEEYFKEDLVFFEQIMNLLPTVASSSCSLSCINGSAILVNPKTKSIRCSVISDHHKNDDMKSLEAKTRNEANLEKECKINFLESHVAFRIIQLVSEQDLCLLHDENQNSSTIKMMDDDSSANDNYLCTGLHYYTNLEPCLMCAMALLHSRVKRIYFVEKLEGVGGLVSATKLHSLPTLNHHFQVYQVVKKSDLNETY